MKNARYVLFVAGSIFAFILMACGGATPTPLVIVVTATPQPATEIPAVAPTQTLVLAPVALAGPQSGDLMKWIDGSRLVYIPPGEFQMGNNGFDAPMHTVTLDGYWIYQTKVTNRMFEQCVAVGSCTPPAQEVGGSVFGNPQFDNHPVVGVTWDQAGAYCAWSQGTLPTEAQWEKAARGVSGIDFPWGNDEPICDRLNFGYCIGRTSDVDSFPEGRSPYGLFDMAGNVFEWVGDWYSAAYYDEAQLVNPGGPSSGEYRSIRGSSFETDPDKVNIANRHYGAGVYHNRDLGFRCAVAQPQPIAPYCQLAAFVPTGKIVSNGCELPEAVVVNQYCSKGDGYATVQLSFGSIYDVKGFLMQCQEVIEAGHRNLVCLGPRAKEATNEIEVCSPACGNVPDTTGVSPVCDAGYTLDPSNGTCNYTPILGGLNVAGCPVGYTIFDGGAQRSCVPGTDSNGLCAAGMYYDSLAGRCVPPNGVIEAPYGIDNPSLAEQYYAGCAAGYSYSDAFQCCQAITGGIYPGCPAGSSFNTDLGACSPDEIEISGSGCITVRVNTLKCSNPVDVCSRIKSETTCIQASACSWNEKDSLCKMDEQ